MIVIGLILIAVGVISLLIKLDVITGSVWGYSWPVILIILGLYFLSRRLWRRSSGGWWCCPWHSPGEEEKK